MKVGPSQPPVRRVAANHHMLCWLKTVVVSDVEKGAQDASGGDRKDGAQSSFSGVVVDVS